MVARRDRAWSSSQPGRKFVIIACTLMVSLSTWPAYAGAGVGEIRYGDSFGNLVIHSPSGYKRIIVGQGHHAETEKHARGKRPRMAYLERERGRLYLRDYKPCRFGARVKGRSYMYGLPKNAVPVISGPCR